MSYLGEVARYAHDAGGVTSVTTGVTSPVAVGTTLVLLVNASASNASTLGVTDTGANTWTQVGSQQGNSLINGQLFAFRADTTTALTASDTITVTNSAGTVNSWLIDVLAYDDAGDIQSTDGNNSAWGTALDTDETGTATGDEYVIGVWDYVYGTFPHTFTAGSGLTLLDALETTGDATMGLVVGQKTITASGSRAVSATADSNVAWAGLSLAIEDTSAPPTPAYTHYRYNGTTWVPQTVTLL